jgi:hypothetical protein
VMGNGGAIVLLLVLVSAACSSGDATTSTESTDSTIAATTVPGDDENASAPPTDATTTVASSVATEAGVLDGIWHKPLDPDVSFDIPITTQFGPGDLFVLDGRAQLTAPVFRGRYTFVDDVVSYVDNEIVDGPCSTDGGNKRLAITLIDDGQIDTEVLEAGGCSAEVGTPASMIRLSPASTAGAAITPPDGEFDDTPAFLSQMKGIWLREGTGEVVYFHFDGTYARSDTGDVVADPDDRGTFGIVTPDAAAGDDNELASVVMTSDGTSKCAVGSTLTWDAVEWNKVPAGIGPPLGPIGAVHTIADDACGMSSGNQTWIHVSGA